MIEIRPLDNSNPDDHVQLEFILNEYIRDSTSNINGTYGIDISPSYATWIIDQFRIHNPRDFIIYAKFENSIISRIIIGYKFEIGWGRKSEEIVDTLPYWCFGLLYFNKKEWRTPKSRLSELTSDLVRHFEKQGYYKIYMIKKTPHKIMELGDPNSYGNLDNWLSQMPGSDRYNTTIERIFYTQNDVDEFKKRFKAISSIVPKSINKSIMMVSFTLKPNLPFKT